MAAQDFHDKSFDDGTLTKLELFQLYTREWLPVFLSNEAIAPSEIHLFDFFAGPGSDVNGVLGSPLRTLATLKEYSTEGLSGWGKIPITCHFFDASERKTQALAAAIDRSAFDLAGVSLEIKALKFTESFSACRNILRSSVSAKLLLIDQFGVDSVTDEVFRELIEFPKADFLFFISSATLHRFREHPAIKQRITPASDYFHVHRAVLEYYRNLIPKGKRYYLAPFSIKKGSNIYGLVFGSAHPLGVDKFLTVAWSKDRINGEADFDLNREHLSEPEAFLPLDNLFRPRKVTDFERALEDAFSKKALQNERDVLEMCFGHGVTRQHARPVIQKLTLSKFIDAEFQVPSLRYIKEPRKVVYL